MVTLVTAEGEYFPWQLQQICAFISGLFLGEDNDVTSEGEIMGGGVLDIRWEMVEFLVVDVFPFLGLLTGVSEEDKFKLFLLGLVVCLKGFINDL